MIRHPRRIPKRMVIPFIIFSILGASATISSVIWVNSWTLNGIGFSGFTKVVYSSIISPFLTLHTATSVIPSVSGLNPVVSKSKTQYVSNSGTIGSTSLARYPSTPYITLIGAASRISCVVILPSFFIFIHCWPLLL